MAPQQTQSAQPSAPQVITPNKKGNKTCLIVALVILGFFVLAGIGGTLVSVFIINKAVDSIKENADISLSEKGVTLKDKNTGQEVNINGNKDTGDVSIKSDQGSINTSAKLPADFPSVLPVYSNAKVDSATTTKDNKTGKNSYLVSFTSSDSYNAIKSFYDSKLSKSNGWNISSTDTSSSTEGQSTIYTGQNGDINIWLTLSTKDGKTQISLISGYGDNEPTTTP